MRTARCDLRKRVASAGLAALVLPGLAGCFVYRGVPATALRAGDVAEVVLRPVADSALAPVVGPRAARLDGRVLAAQDSLLTLAVTTVTRGPQLVPESWPGDSVRVPLVAVDVAQVRRFDRRRSALLAGATVAALLGVRAAMGDGALARGRGVPPGGSK